MQTSNPFLALLKNNELRNPAFWKKLQSLVLLLIGLAPFLRFIFPSYADVLNEKMLNDLSAALATVALYLTSATSAKVGL